jgi:putative heme-binding domain-containing protein
MASFVLNRTLFSGIAFLALTAVTQLNALATDHPATPRPAWSTSRLRGAATPPAPYQIRPVFPGVKFDHPTSLQEIPGTGRILVTEMSGRILTFEKKPEVASADEAGNLSTIAGGPVSLYSAILDPKFEQTQQLYVCTKHPQGGSHSRVSRFRCMSSATSFRIDPQSEEVIIQWPSGGHNGGCLQFGNDDLLYISTGDGSGPNPPDGLTTGQDVTDLLGAILRIDVRHPGEGRAYSIPADNPFAAHSSAKPEIFAYGLRNPWKFGIDQQTGDVFVADNGWETWEMIHHVKAGTNCGWPVMEGRAELRKEVAPGPTPITPPAWDHPHSEANSVIGGPVYRGAKIPDLQGCFIYGDYITGTIWTVKREADNTYSSRTLVDTDQRIVAFAEGCSGELLMLDYDLSGQIYELLPNDAQDLSASFPRQLSQTGLFSSLTNLQPSPGVISYQVTAERWMDGAAAERWVAVPGTNQITLGSDTATGSAFPDGTVFVKNVSIPAAGGRGALNQETQILHRDGGTWNPYSYQWNSEGTDAELVGPEGAIRTVKWPKSGSASETEDRTWRIGALNECRLCHNSGPGFVLGFVTNQLSGTTSATSSSTGPSATDQLTRLVQQKVITPSHSIDRQHAAWLVDPHDTTQQLNDRARSYLHANCSMCHHKGGNAIVSIFLKRDLPFEQMNTNKGTGIGTFGIRNAKIIVPGDPWRSVLMYRISKLGYARMPYIGSQVVDSRGVALVSEWIQSLPGPQTAESSTPLISDSEDGKALQHLLSVSVDAETKERDVQQLIKSTEGALALQSRMHSAGFDTDTTRSILAAAAQAGSDVRGLVEHFVPEASRKKTLGQSFDAQLVLTRTGDASRGQLIFFSDNARCRNCHHISDAAQSVGPTLTEISRKYSNPEELLQQIVAPSLKIDDRFASWLAVTSDGRTVAGLMESESDTEIVLRTTERKSIRLQRKDLDELQKSSRSLMPDSVLADQTAQEAADLLAFIRSIGTPTAQ